jgi:hypothetical protein
VWTDTETTQTSVESVRYWATGLEPLYLEGALVRALERPEALRRRLSGTDRLAEKARSYERMARALAAEARELRVLARTYK